MRDFKRLLPVTVFAIALPILPGCSSQQTETTTTQSQPNARWINLDDHHDDQKGTTIMTASWAQRGTSSGR